LTEARRPRNTTPHAASDVVTASLASRFLVTLGYPWRDFAEGDEAPLGLHWCLAPEILEGNDLAPDGIATNGIIPMLDPPRRMWAGGTVHLLAPLRIGDKVVRQSAVTDVSHRQGRTGHLIFARIGHDYSVEGAARLHEEQTIVYREADAPAAIRPREEREADSAPQGRTVLRSVETTEAMLFRFSALTFNAHRIHYDRDYATGLEGYPSLLVHGTLTASLMLEAYAKTIVPVRSLSFTIRALAPISCGSRLTISCRRTSGGYDLQVHDGNEVVMTGTAA
jgi:3-methylfumaryl-CoA hydratase